MTLDTRDAPEPTQSPGPESARRRAGSRQRWAWETEALGQGEIQRLVREARDDLLPATARTSSRKERRQRRQVAKVLDEPNQTKGKMNMTALSAEEAKYFVFPSDERRVRKLAKIMGYRIWKPRSDRHSQYMPYSLIDLQTRAIVRSSQLWDIEDRLRDEGGE